MSRNATPEMVIRAQLQEQAEREEIIVVEEVQASLKLLHNSVNRLVAHRRINGLQENVNPRIDFLLADSTLKACSELMRL